jgi:hypothetical protein
MSKLVALPTPEGLPDTKGPTLVSPAGTGWQLPEMTPEAARLLAVALLEEAEAQCPAPVDTGLLPFGWKRLSLVVPDVDQAPVVELVRQMRREGAGRGKVAQELNARGLTTQTGGRWHANAVARLERAWSMESRRRWTVPTVHRLL